MKDAEIFPTPLKGSRPPQNDPIATYGNLGIIGDSILVPLGGSALMLAVSSAASQACEYKPLSMCSTLSSQTILKFQSWGRV